MDRRVSSRGSVSIARQKIQVGIGHAGQTVTIEEADTTFRVYHDQQLLTEVIRTTTRPIARFKARKPEPPRKQKRRRPPPGVRLTEEQFTDPSGAGAARRVPKE